MSRTLLVAGNICSEQTERNAPQSICYRAVFMSGTDAVLTEDGVSKSPTRYHRRDVSFD